ncbi:MAG: DUF3365 domain-containing protein [Epsilonproteobacteria bacterium]|nr:DUF3365 domain-containing protein [Campylobacterota bacterium]
MKKRFYTIALAPLLFVACNTVDSPAPAQQSAQKVTTEVSSATNQVQEVISANNIKYVSNPDVIERGMGHVKGFIGTLQPTLKGALQQDKTHETAMGTCSSIAMQMTQDYNNVSPNGKVRRTALKYRNPANKPDAIDKEVMYRLQAVNDGKPIAVDMGTKYRVYKPLQMKKPCLLCHGDMNKMTPEVQNIIKTKYPQDLATGFKLGEFRGVVVAEIPK